MAAKSTPTWVRTLMRTKEVNQECIEAARLAIGTGGLPLPAARVTLLEGVTGPWADELRTISTAAVNTNSVMASMLVNSYRCAHSLRKPVVITEACDDQPLFRSQVRLMDLAGPVEGEWTIGQTRPEAQQAAFVSLVHVMAANRLQRRCGTQIPEGTSPTVAQTPAIRAVLRATSTDKVPLPDDESFAEQFRRRFRSPNAHLVEATSLRAISGLLEVSQLVQLLFEARHPRWEPAKLGAIAGLSRTPMRLRQVLNSYCDRHRLQWVQYTETSHNREQVGKARLQLLNGEVVRVSTSGAASHEVRDDAYLKLLVRATDVPDAVVRADTLQASGHTRPDNQTALQTLQGLEVLAGHITLQNPAFTLNPDGTWLCRLHSAVNGAAVGSTGVGVDRADAREQAARVLLLTINKRTSKPLEAEVRRTFHQATQGADEQRHIIHQTIETPPAEQPPRPRGFIERRATADLPRSAVVNLLSAGAGLAFDPVAEGVGALLCLEPLTSPSDVPGNSTTRPFLLPGGEVRTLRSWTVDVLALLDVLTGDTPTHWSASAAFWAGTTRMALEIIRDRRVLPTIKDAGNRNHHLPTWRAMSISDSTPIDDLLSQIQTLPTPISPGGTARPTPELLTGYFDLVVDAFVPSTARAAVHGPVPFVGHILTEDPIAPLLDWTDEVEDLASDLKQLPLVLRLGPPDTESQTVTATLLITDDAGQTREARDIWESGPPGPASGGRLHHRCRRALRRLAGRLTSLQPLAEAMWPDAALFSLHDIVALRGGLSAELADEGLQIEWTTDWASEIAVSVDVTIPEARPRTDHRFGLFEIFDRRWRLTLDGKELTRTELQRLAAATLPCIRLRNRWIVLTSDLKDKAREPRVGTDAVQARCILDALQGFIEIEGVRYACTQAVGLAKLLAVLRGAMTALPAEGSLPHSQLDPYQHQAVQWLEALEEAGLGGLLADEAGAGKTPSAIAFHLSPHRRGHHRPTLVLVPNTANIDKWRDELRRFAPQEIVHNYGRSIRSSFHRKVSGRCVLLATYATLRRNQHLFASLDWGLVIADEAQTIKNPKTSVRRCAASLRTDSRLALSGTPLENGPGDMFALLDWCNPNLMGDYPTFKKYVVDPALAAADPHQTMLDVVRPFIMRRLKSDPQLGLNLPQLTTTKHMVDMSHEQRGMYESMLIDTRDERRIGGTTAGKLVLKVITALRKISISPAHFADDNVDVEPREAMARTPKFAKLEELLQPVATTDECVLVYTSFRRAAELIVKFLDSSGYPTAVYHGRLRRRERSSVMQNVAEGKVKILVMTLQSGGVGLDITRPSHVVHFDVHPNPAIEEQGTARVHRRGQTRPVHVHKLISVNSIEQRLDQLQIEKRQLASQLVPNGAGRWPKQLSVEPFQLLNSLSGGLPDE
jgi:superfamily II DNA or RNA helicase